MVFLFLMQMVWKYIEDIAGKGIEWYVIVELLFYSTAGVVPMALPIAVLLSSLMTVGDFGENYELAAMKSAGVSLFRIMRPMLGVVLLLSVGAFFFYNNDFKDQEFTSCPIFNQSFNLVYWLVLVL